MNKPITIDASGKRLGVVASRIALALRGKMVSDFLPNRTALPRVIVKNVDMLDLVEKKLKEMEIARYTGYPGGRRIKSGYEVAAKDKTILLKKAVLGMLPRNRLRKIMVKNLNLFHGEDR